MGARGIVLGLCLGAALSGPAWGQSSGDSSGEAGASGQLSVAEHIERARQAEEQLEYIAAYQELVKALSDERATEEERIEAHFLAGIVCLVLELDVEAEGHFQYVLKRRPEVIMPAHVSPKIRDVFKKLRKKLGADQRAQELLEQQREAARQRAEAERLEAERLEAEKKAALANDEPWVEIGLEPKHTPQYQDGPRAPIRPRPADKITEIDPDAPELTDPDLDEDEEEDDEDEGESSGLTGVLVGMGVGVGVVVGLTVIYVVALAVVFLVPVLLTVAAGQSAGQPASFVGPPSLLFVPPSGEPPPSG